MPEKLKLKAGAEVPEEAELYEGFKILENRITANVGIDKIGDVMAHFLAMHDEPVFLFLEIPTNMENETFSAPGKTEAFHKDIYYLDGCSIEKQYRYWTVTEIFCSMTGCYLLVLEVISAETR